MGSGKIWKRKIAQSYYFHLNQSSRFGILCLSGNFSRSDFGTLFKDWVSEDPLSPVQGLTETYPYHEPLTVQVPKQEEPKRKQPAVFILIIIPIRVD